MKDDLHRSTKDNAPASPLRRKTIKTLAVGVGALAGSTVLPEKWVTPIIQGIALPAHAQTSAPLQLAFCNGRVDLQLVSGNSGTSSMTIRATGCITPAQANVTLNLTLAGYAQAVITENGTPIDSGFLTAVSEALVPSAHAAQQPLCSQQASVQTAGDGSFVAEFTLPCGPGIVQVELTASTSGPANQRAGWLDIPGCNPCAGTTSSSSATAVSGCPVGTEVKFVDETNGVWFVINGIEEFSFTGTRVIDSITEIAVRNSYASAATPVTLNGALLTTVALGDTVVLFTPANMTALCDGELVI